MPAPNVPVLNLLLPDTVWMVWGNAKSHMYIFNHLNLTTDNVIFGKRTVTCAQSPEKSI